MANFTTAILLCVQLSYIPQSPPVIPVCRSPEYLERYCRQVAQDVYLCPERKVQHGGPRA